MMLPLLAILKDMVWYALTSCAGLVMDVSGKVLGGFHEQCLLLHESLCCLLHWLAIRHGDFQPPPLSLS